MNTIIQTILWAMILAIIVGTVTKRMMYQVDENNRLIKNLIQLHRGKINE